MHRLWKQEQLSHKKRLKKRRTGAIVPVAATHANQVWCLDFCHDACLNGTKLKILAVKDAYTRECLALEVATGFNSHRVKEILQGLVGEHGPEFIARHLSLWLESYGSRSQFIALGAPWQNGHAESFMSRLGTECLDAEVFFNLADAKLKLGLFRRYYNQVRPCPKASALGRPAGFRRYYNQVRPHSALGYIPPAQFAQQNHGGSG